MALKWPMILSETWRPETILVPVTMREPVTMTAELEMMAEKVTMEGGSCWQATRVTRMVRTTWP